MKYTHTLSLHFIFRSVCTLGAIISLLTYSVLTASADTSHALIYLENSEQSTWRTMAFAAIDRDSDVTFLEGVNADTAIELEAPILALTAAGKDPRTYPSSDLIEELRSHYSENQLGDPTLLNDDIFGLLALRAAGVPDTDSLISALTQYLKEHQNTDGGFPYAVDGTSDTNTTAAAIQALIEAGLSTSDQSISHALTYLHAAQNEDGGFPYDPQSPYGTDSDASSDAWVLTALTKAGEDLSDWTKDGNSPKDHLLSLQTDSGYFEYQPGAGENGFSAVTTSYAVIALSGATFPVAHISAPPTNEDKTDDTDNTETTGTAHFTIIGSSGILCSGTLDTDTALSVVVDAAPLCDYTYAIEDTEYGSYVASIGDDIASGSDGWLYSVNGTTPMLGAGEYTLDSNDTVRWYFSDSADSADPEAEYSHAVSLKADLLVDATSTSDTIAFSITPGELDFGTVQPGDEYSDVFEINNIGDVPIEIESSVAGGSLFRDLLTLQMQPWRDWSLSLEENDTRSVTAQLDIPNSYDAPREQSGDLVFWARAAE